MTRDELELRLVEQINGIWFTYREAAAELGVENPPPITDDDLSLDSDLIASVAYYLTDVEELGRDGDDEDDVEQLLTIGMYIYGYMMELRQVQP